MYIYMCVCVCVLTLCVCVNSMLWISSVAVCVLSSSGVSPSWFLKQGRTKSKGDL